ncbi:MAG TPA: flagellar basal body rod protein FlgC [Acidobacteriaceae bacterium]|nr:flagellar basal body rod protein FlgC [Acidobacteriaceae bacterium]
MNLFGVMDISSSALEAERVRAEVVAANMANAETTRTADGGPYRRQHVVFQQAGDGFAQTLLANGGGGFSGPGMLAGGAGFGSSIGSMAVPGGVQVAGVVEDQSAPLERYDPTHPDAGPDGYVAYPDINPLTEMVDLMGATRSYGLNATAVQAEKNMVSSSLEILK